MSKLIMPGVPPRPDQAKPDQARSDGAGQAAVQPAGDLIVDTTTRDFKADVLDASRQVPVLVDFWAPWCGPCKQLTPALERAVTAAGGRVKLVKMNIDEHPEIAGQLGVQSIPAVFVFVNGQPVDGFMGAVPESQITALIDKVAGPAGPSAEDDALAEAERLFGEGEIAEAGRLFAAVLQSDPQNAAALGGIARCLIQAGDIDRARQTLAVVPPDEADNAAVTAAKAALDLADSVADLGNPAELEARIAADPTDHQARFDLAQIRQAQGNSAGALDDLLEIVRQDRNWSEGAARQKLLQLFEAWGPQSELTRDGRRRLSSILFS